MRAWRRRAPASIAPALPELDRARQAALRPSASFALLLQLGSFEWFALGDLDRGLELLRRALGRAREPADAAAAQAALGHAASESDPQGACALLEAALAAGHAPAETTVDLARAAHFAGDSARALELLSRAKGMDGVPMDEVWLVRGLTLAAFDPGVAKAALERCAALRVASGTLTGEADLLLSQLDGCAPSEQAARLQRCADIREARGARALAADALYRRGALLGDASVLERSVDLWETPEAQLHLGVLLHAQSSSARLAYERSIALDETYANGDALFNLALLLEGDLDDAAGARAAYERCIAVREARGTLVGQAHFRLGSLLAGEGARRAFERCVELRFREDEAQWELGLLLEDMGDAAGARAAYERCIAIREAQGTLTGHAFYNLGLLLAGDDLGDAAGARAAYERCIAIREAQGTLTGHAHYNLALLLADELRDPAGAWGAYDRCIAIREAQGTLTGNELFNLGVLLDSPALFARAADVYERRYGAEHKETRAARRRAGPGSSHKG